MKLLALLILKSDKVNIFPIYINLSSLGSKTQVLDYNISSFRNYIKEQFYHQYLCDRDYYNFVETYCFQKLCEENKVLFLFDSFEEVFKSRDLPSSIQQVIHIHNLIRHVSVGCKTVIATQETKILDRVVFNQNQILSIFPLNKKAVEKELLIVGVPANNILSTVQSNFELYYQLRIPQTLHLFKEYLYEKSTTPNSLGEMLSYFLIERLDNKFFLKLKELNTDKKHLIDTCIEIANSISKNKGLGYSIENISKDVISILFSLKIGIVKGQEFYFSNQMYHDYFIALNLKSNREEKKRRLKQISNNDSIDSSFLLYCQITDEDEAILFANQIWKKIKQINISKTSVDNKKYIHLIRMLRFLKAAFKSRKTIILHSNIDIAPLLYSMLRSGNLLYIKHSLEFICFIKGNSSFILEALKMESKWINDKIFDVLVDIDLTNEVEELIAIHNLRRNILKEKWLENKYLLGNRKLFQVERLRFTESIVVLLLSITLVILSILYSYDYLYLAAILLLNTLLYNGGYVSQCIVNKFKHLPKKIYNNSLRNHLGITVVGGMLFLKVLWLLLSIIITKINPEFAILLVCVLFGLSISIPLRIIRDRFFSTKKTKEILTNEVQIRKRIKIKPFLEKNLTKIKTPMEKVSFLRKLKLLSDSGQIMLDFAGKWQNPEMINDNNDDASGIIADLQEYSIGLNENFSEQIPIEETKEKNLFQKIIHELKFIDD